jgi:hypothetical protein
MLLSPRVKLVKNNVVRIRAVKRLITRSCAAKAIRCRDEEPVDVAFYCVLQDLIACPHSNGFIENAFGLILFGSCDVDFCPRFAVHRQANDRKSRGQSGLSILTRKTQVSVPKPSRIVCDSFPSEDGPNDKELPRFQVERMTSKLAALRMSQSSREELTHIVSFLLVKVVRKL